MRVTLIIPDNMEMLEHFGENPMGPFDPLAKNFNPILPPEEAAKMAEANVVVAMGEKNIYPNPSGSPEGVIVVYFVYNVDSKAYTMVEKK